MMPKYGSISALERGDHPSHRHSTRVRVCGSAGRGLVESELPAGSPRPMRSSGLHTKVTFGGRGKRPAVCPCDLFVGPAGAGGHRRSAVGRSRQPGTPSCGRPERRWSASPGRGAHGAHVRARARRRPGARAGVRRRPAHRARRCARARRACRSPRWGAPRASSKRPCGIIFERHSATVNGAPETVNGAPEWTTPGARRGSGARPLLLGGRAHHRGLRPAGPQRA